MNKINFITICASTKEKYACEAINLYKGAYFNIVREINKLVDETYIISAKHGLIHSSKILEPYKVSFSQGEDYIKEDPTKYWDSLYNSQIYNIINNNLDDKFIIYISGPYMKAVKNDLKKCIQNPNVYLFCSNPPVKEFDKCCIKPSFGVVKGNRISLCASVIKHFLENQEEITWDKQKIKLYYGKKNIPTIKENQQIYFRGQLITI